MHGVEDVEASVLEDIKKSGKLSRTMSRARFSYFTRSRNGVYQVAFGDGYGTSGGKGFIGGLVCLIEGSRPRKVRWVKQLERPLECHVSDDGKVIVADWLWQKEAGELAGKIYIFNRDGSLIFEKKFDSNICSCAVSPDGKYALTGTCHPDCQVYFFDIDEGKVKWHKRPMKKKMNVDHFEFMPGGRIRASTNLRVPRRHFFEFDLEGSLITYSRGYWSESKIRAELYSSMKKSLDRLSALSVGFEDVITEFPVRGGRADLVVTTESGPFFIVETKRQFEKEWDLYSPEVVSQALQYARELGSPFFAVCDGKSIGVFDTRSEYIYPLAVYEVEFSEEFARMLLKELAEFQAHSSSTLPGTEDLDNLWAEILVNALRLFTSNLDIEANIESVRGLGRKKARLFMQLVYEGVICLEASEVATTDDERRRLLRRSSKLLDRALELAPPEVRYSIQRRRARVLSALGEREEASELKKELDKEIFDKYYSERTTETGREGITLYYEAVRTVDEDPEKALQCLKRALELNSYYMIWAPYWSYKGFALLSLGRLREALECFNKRIELHRTYGGKVSYGTLSGKAKCLEGLCIEFPSIDDLTNLIETYKLMLERKPSAEVAEKERKALEKHYKMIKQLRDRSVLSRLRSLVGLS